MSILFSLLSKNNRKLHSLLLPLNLNLNYENFVFAAKVLLLFEIAKFFYEKMRFFCKMQCFCTYKACILPIFSLFLPLM